MKKIFILIYMVILLYGCNSVTMTDEIPDYKFNKGIEIVEFDVENYIVTLEELLSDENYKRVDAIGSFTSIVNSKYIAPDAPKNILEIFNYYAKNHNTYKTINFFDLHISEISDIDRNILLLRLVKKIEDDLSIYESIPENEMFIYVLENYMTQFTSTLLDKIKISDEAIEVYPDIENYILKLKSVINGGYQICEIDNKYQVFPDYASVLNKYDEFYLDEEEMFATILSRESKKVVNRDGSLQIDNDKIAYKINQMEIFLNKYSNSMYYEQVREKYVENFYCVIENESNTESSRFGEEKYKLSVILDFQETVNRYENTEMSKILNDLVDIINKNNYNYDEASIEQMKKKILSRY